MIGTLADKLVDTMPELEDRRTYHLLIEYLGPLRVRLARPVVESLSPKSRRNFDAVLRQRGYWLHAAGPATFDYRRQ